MLNKNSERELAYVVKIDAIEPIVGSDNCEAAIVGGWRVMVRKGTFEPNDLAIYFEIDSKVDTTRPEFAFLEKKGGKIKTQRYTFGGKGLMISQGLLMAPTDFGWEQVENEDGHGPFIIDNKTGHCMMVDDESRFLTKELGVTYSVEEDNSRKAASVDKYKKMAGRHPNLFKKPWARWMMKRQWGRKVMFFFFGKKKDKKDDKGWPVGKFPGVSKTDQERCLIAQTKIMTDHGIKTIADIVNNKLPVRVLSMNDDGTLSYKSILDYQKFDNPGGEVMTIEYPYKVGASRVNHLCCTKDHRVFTNRGYIVANELKVGDLVYSPVDAYEDSCLAPIYGMLLGDSHIYRDKRSNSLLRVVATNGEDQLEYLKYKKSLFGEGSICDAGLGSFSKEKHCYHYNLPIDPYVDMNLKNDFFIDGKKTITDSALSKMTEESLAFWYMDDGNLSYRESKNQSPSIRLNTQGFSREINNKLANLLNDKFGISCHVTKENKNGKEYYHIYIDVNGTPKFLAMVTPYMCRVMAYKTLPEYEHLLETKKRTYKKINRVLPCPILNIYCGQHKSKVLPKKFSVVYDIEVEENHNFVADGIVTHNCENMPWILNDKTPFIVTQKCDGSSGTYILERAKKNKYEFYVCSRNVRMLKPEQECYYGDKNYYWEVAKKYKIEECMKDYLEKNPDISFVCWQGEICAPGIQKNPHNLKETHFYAFHMTDSKNGRYDIRDAAKVWQHYGIEVVPIVCDDYIMPDDFEEFKLSADGLYDSDVCEGHADCKREGFVYYKTTDPNFSFKNVSREYLLKHNG